MQLDLPALFFLTLPVYIRANRNPHSPLLDETGSNRTGLFSRLLETCCWKIVPSPCGCISIEPKLRLFIMGGERGINDVNAGSIQRIHCFEEASFTLAIVLGFRPPPRFIGVPPSLSSPFPSPSFVFRGASFPSCGSVGDREISRHRYFFTVRVFLLYSSFVPRFVSRKFLVASGFFFFIIIISLLLN